VLQKALLVSILVATFAIPALLHREGRPWSWRSVLSVFAAFTAVYVFALLFIYPRLP
jgi:hypothetical protein